MCWWRRAGAAAPRLATEHCMCSSAACAPRSHPPVSASFYTRRVGSGTRCGQTRLEEYLDFAAPDILVFRDLPVRLHALRSCDVVRFGLLVERSEEHTSELQSLRHLVCRLLLEKKK